MSKANNKPQAVADAEAALAAKGAELQAAKEAVKQLEHEHAELGAALRKAREDADNGLPQCRTVRVRWRTSNEEDAGRHVILRRTPTGILVTRPVGGSSEWRFKWSKYSGKYIDTAKGGWASDSMHLRDVPAEFLPATAQEEVES